MLLSEFNTLKRASAGEWSPLDDVFTRGGAIAWGMMFKVGIAFAIISLMIVGLLFLFKNDSKNIAENKKNAMTKFALICFFLCLVAVVTLFQSSLVFE